MAAIVLKAVKAEPSGYYLKVWVDNTQFDTEGNPHPDYVKSWQWGLWPPGNMTENDYLWSIREGLQQRVYMELNGINTNANQSPDIEGVVVSLQGQEIVPAP